MTTPPATESKPQPNVVIEDGKRLSESLIWTLQRAFYAAQGPAAWKAKKEEGTQRYDAPSGDAYFLLDVGHTARPMSGEECRAKILAGMGAEDAEKLSIGQAPAAKQFASDKSEDGKSEVHTYTFVGCDGKATWSLVFHLDAKKAKRYAPLAEKIAKSVQYR